jgi:hypothetical protein
MGVGGVASFAQQFVERFGDFMGHSFDRRLVTDEIERVQMSRP